MSDGEKSPPLTYIEGVVMDNILEQGSIIEIGKVNKAIRGKLATAIKNGDADLIFQPILCHGTGWKNRDEYSTDELAEEVDNYYRHVVMDGLTDKTGFNMFLYADTVTTDIVAGGIYDEDDIDGWNRDTDFEIRWKKGKHL